MLWSNVGRGMNRGNAKDDMLCASPAERISTNRQFVLLCGVELSGGPTPR